jgi:hypothetical protein
MEPKGQLLRQQELISGPYPKSNESSPHSHTLLI